MEFEKLKNDKTENKTENIIQNKKIIQQYNYDTKLTEITILTNNSIIKLNELSKSVPLDAILLRPDELQHLMGD